MSAELDAWFAAAGPVEAELRRVDALLMAALTAAPGGADGDRRLVPSGAGRALAYGRAASPPAAAGDPLVVLAARDGQVSLDVHAAAGGRALVEGRARRLGAACTGSRLLFRALDDVDVVELDRLVRDAAAGRVG